MGILVIDGKSVYEIDENCVRHRNLPKECGVNEHLQKKNPDRQREKNPGNQRRRGS